MAVAYDIAIRSLIAYFVLLTLARIMGKREISQMTFFDYIVGITIGSMTANMAINTSLRWYYSVIGLLIFTTLQLLTAFISLKSVRFREVVDGTSTVLIEHGNLNEKNLRKERLNTSVLASMLREKNIFSFADVEYAILENDGKISAIKKSGKQPLTPSDMKLQTEQTGLPRIIIEDGNFIDETISHIGLTRSWILSKLGDRGIYHVSNVMLAQVDEAGNFYVDTYDKYENSVKKDESLDMILVKLERIRADFFSYAMETKNEKAQKLYNECKDRIESIIYNFGYYVEQKKAKDNTVKKHFH
ncbi:MAG TPA: DUF421 domain-containing protein [Clostridia bacterium]|nr:DUF421 domain-containing protein [Clostridia bacterium]